MRKFLLWGLSLAVLAAGLGLYITRPAYVPDEALAGLEPDLAAGELAFHTAGCASCHSAPQASGEDRLILSGGKRFVSDFGTFVAPNISSHPEAGIGDWSIAEIVTAVAKGTSPDGEHYYPAFPYGSYGGASLQDLVSLAAYVKTLPASDTPSQPHELGFPFNIRATVGGWKLLFGNRQAAFDPGSDPQLLRGQYLSETLGHCGECHTPRNALGGLDMDLWFAGAPNPSGQGRIPNITPAKLTWSAVDIREYLRSGFTPDFDVAGSSMADVVTSLANLPVEDLDAIAAYMKAVPALD